MSLRSKAIAATIVILACTTIISLARQHYPYIYPADVCFTKNGVAVGALEACMENTGQTLAEFTINWEMHGERERRDSPKICQRLCQEYEFCSYYALRPPADYYDKDVIVETDTYACSLYGWNGAKQR